MKVQTLLKNIPIQTNEFGRKIESNFEKWLKGTFGDRSYAIYPYVYQNSDFFRDFRYDLYKKLKSIEPGDLEWSNTETLLGEMGQASSHILLPFNDAKILRKDLGLPKVTQEDLQNFRELIRDIIKAAEWEGFSVKDKSSSGYPFFIKGVGFKLSQVSETFKKLDSILDACAKRNIEKVRKLFGYLPIFTLGVRYQIDSIVHTKGISTVAKKRRAYDPVFVKSNGEQGYSVDIDYTVRSANGFVDNRFCAARVRSMYALSYGYNCVVQAINNFLVSGLKKVCPEINFSTPDECLSFLNSVGPDDKVAIDYSNYGETIPGEFVEVICEELEIVRSGLGEFLRLTYNAPKLVRGWQKNVNDPFFTSDEVDFFGPITGSLPSGHGLVAFLGKVCAVYDGFRFFRNVLPSFSKDNYLQGKYALFKRKSSSDDGIHNFADPSLKREFCDSFERNSLFKANITESPTYLGYVYLKLRVTRDIARLLEHLTNFERGMQSKMFFELGIGCSIQEYMLNTYFTEVFPILQEEFSSKLKVDLSYYLSKAKDLAEPTAIFLANPDSIFYKLDPKLVNKGIYKQMFANVSTENVKYYFER